jgi:hypothetical protein
MKTTNVDFAKRESRIGKMGEANAFPYPYTWYRFQKSKGAFPPQIFIWHDHVGHFPCPPAPTWRCFQQSEHGIIFKPQTNFSTMNLHKGNPSRK